MDVNLERLSKQLANISATGQASRMAQHALAWPQIPSPTVWTGIQAAEQQWLLHQKHNAPPPTNAIAQSLSRVPEIRLPELQKPEWLDGILEVSQNVSSYFAQINSMVERVADNMAAPLARISQISEELARPVQGWQQLVNNMPSVWDFEGFLKDLQPILQDFIILLEDAETGREVLRASEFGFAEHFWGIFYVRGFAHINPRVRSAVVTTRLA